MSTGGFVFLTVSAGVLVAFVFGAKSKRVPQCPNCGGYRTERRRGGFSCSICGRTWRRTELDRQIDRALVRGTPLVRFGWVVAIIALLGIAIAPVHLSNEHGFQYYLVSDSLTVWTIVVSALLLVGGIAMCVAGYVRRSSGRLLASRLGSQVPEVLPNRELLTKHFENEQVALAAQTHQYLTGDPNSLL